MHLFKHISNIVSGDRYHWNIISIKTFAELHKRAYQNIHGDQYFLCKTILIFSEELVKSILSPEKEFPILPGRFRKMDASHIREYLRLIFIAHARSFVAFGWVQKHSMERLHQIIFQETMSYDGVEVRELGDLRLPISPGKLWMKLLESDGLQAGPKEWAGLVVFEIELEGNIRNALIMSRRWSDLGSL